jgi:exopolyphosphatase / guanosine-5'-triphosphate,3'-diphosphate pyrophosphatase
MFCVSGQNMGYKDNGTPASKQGPLSRFPGRTLLRIRVGQSAPPANRCPMNPAPASRHAVIDLGTNTFHLLIADAWPDGSYHTLFRESRPAKIGKGGIDRGILTDEGMERALVVLHYFGQKLAEFDVDPGAVQAIGTSAIRVARNQADFVARVQTETGIPIRVVSGHEEAGLIYAGIRAAGALDDQTALVVDIGGGSVEFILGTRERVFWQQSFEIGGQRLLERFMPDPSLAISPVAVRRLLPDFFREALLPLQNAVHQYPPSVLVGSSGSFDTLVDLWYWHERGHWPPSDEPTFNLPVAEFYRSYQLLLAGNQAERMALPGMIELRVDMIVVAVVLIDYLLTTFGLTQIRTSTWSLKEGVLALSAAERTTD